MIGALLIGSAIFVYATNWERVREIDLFALVLVVQSLPFLASVALATLEGTRANDFAFWRGLESPLCRVADAPACRRSPRHQPRCADRRRRAGRDRAVAA